MMTEKQWRQWRSLVRRVGEMGKVPVGDWLVDSDILRAVNAELEALRKEMAEMTDLIATLREDFKTLAERKP